MKVFRDSRGRFLIGRKRPDLIGNKFAVGTKPSTVFKKGHIPWSKGVKGIIKNHCKKCGGIIGSVKHRCSVPWLKGKTIDRKKHPKMGHFKKHSEVAKEKMSQSHLITAPRGKSHHGWQGGISFEPYGIEFNEELKEEIRKRDNYICQECKYTQEQLGYKLPVHHIDYDKKNNKKENLISLCRPCHGQTNYDRDDWAKYFNMKVGIYG